jgi:hypothetical protein
VLSENWEVGGQFCIIQGQIDFRLDTFYVLLDWCHITSTERFIYVLYNKVY